MNGFLKIIVTEKKDHYLFEVLRPEGVYVYARELELLPDVKPGKGILIRGYLDYVTQSLFEIRYQFYPFIAIAHRSKGNLCVSSTDPKYEIKTALVLEE